MGEAADSRATVEQTLVQKSLEDGAFRQELLANPKATVERELGRQLPPGVEVRVLEETPDTLYLVLPPARVNVRIGDELSEAELNGVSGGQYEDYEAELDGVSGGQYGDYGGPFIWNWR